MERGGSRGIAGDRAGRFRDDVLFDPLGLNDPYCAKNR